MLVTITPSTKQIYRYAESALSGFETLSLDNAVDNAKHELQSLITYLHRLDATEDAVCESFIVPVKSRIKLEMDISNLDKLNSV